MITVRPAVLHDCPVIARLQVDSYLNTYADILPVDYLAHFSYGEQEQDWFELLNSMENQILTVAVDSKVGVIGYCLGNPDSQALPPYQGELVALHINRNFRGKGVGRELFTTVYRALTAADCNSMFTWVLGDNPARGFYEKLGGMLVAERGWQNNQYFGTEIREVAYGWLDK